MTFSDDDLFFWKNLCGNHLEIDDIENLEIHPGTLKLLLARLEAAEDVIATYLDDCYENQPTFAAWRKSKGEGK